MNIIYINIYNISYFISVVMLFLCFLEKSSNICCLYGIFMYFCGVFKISQL